MEIIRSQTFNHWFERLRDSMWKMRIAARIDAIQSVGHFGDARYLRDGVHELRFKSGSGFRVYYARHDQVIVILLCGGDKSTQSSDIQKAVCLAEDFKKQEEERKKSEKKEPSE